MRLNYIDNIDCLEGMKQIPDGSVDMVLCDLPYGTTARNKWDNIIPFSALWKQYDRIVKENGAVCLFAQPPFDKKLAMSNITNLRYEWVWNKKKGTGFLNANKMPLKAHELVLVFYKRLPTYNPQRRPGGPYKRSPGKRMGTNYNEAARVNTVSTGGRYPVDVLEFAPDRGLHPTQKPVALCEYLIRTYTNPGEVVLDNCMGSGTTAVACINTGRNFIGFELDPGYHAIAQQRVADAMAAVQGAKV